MLDTAIIGGTVVDGTGRPRRRLDVGVRGDRIVRLAPTGSLGEAAAHIVDATDRVVAPGFVDVHTHYDAQIFWDPALTPSPLHGVTSVVGGNCGFSLAPLAAGTSEFLMRMMARVEGMPLASLRVGVPWDWNSMAEYLDRVDGALAVNAGFLVGHSAVRRSVMGADASARAANPDELEAMRASVRDALEAGALGFSSSWSNTHNDGDGIPVPSRFATADEILDLCSLLRQYDGRSVEFIPPVTADFTTDDIDLMARMSLEAESPLNWNVLSVTQDTIDSWHTKLIASDVAQTRGASVTALVLPMPTSARLCFATGFVFDGVPGWEDVMALPLAERIDVMADADERARLEAAAAAVRGPLAKPVDWPGKRIMECRDPALRQYEGLLVEDLARAEGKSPFDALVDVAVADSLQTVFSHVRPEPDEVWDARIRACRDPRTVIGASDAGAHLDLLDAFVYTTALLAQAVRERNLLELEEAVHLITDAPARLIGLRDRGRVEEGWYADLVVFDPRTVAPEPVRTVEDLPGDAGRLFAGATGIDHVFCNGSEIVRDGHITEARPGILLRGGRDTQDRTDDVIALRR
jgi:N-acyl-D-aspartate/D-glutamate deacylase